MRRAVGVTVVLLASAARALAADPAGTPASREAMALCNRAEDAPAAEQPALLARALALADAAVAANEGDALAHFARFCILGRQARIAGASLMSLVKLRPIRQAVDRTLALAPDFPPALLGKGSLLLNLPWVLGGDRAEGERLVRRALALDPDYFDARMTLAETLDADGRKSDALAEARRALDTAERQKDDDDAAAARRLVAKLTGP